MPSAHRLEALQEPSLDTGSPVGQLPPELDAAAVVAGGAAVVVLVDEVELVLLVLLLVVVELLVLLVMEPLEDELDPEQSPKHAWQPAPQ